MPHRKQAGSTHILCRAYLRIVQFRGTAARILPHLRTWCHLPALLSWFALGVGIVTGKAIPSPFTNPLYLPILTCAILFFVLCGTVTARRWTRYLFFLLAGLAVIWHSQTTDLIFSAQIPREARTEWSPCSLTGRITSAPLKTGSGYLLHIVCTTLHVGDREIRASGKKLKCHSRTLPPAHGTVACRGRFRAPRRCRNPGAFDQHAHLLMNHIRGVVTTDSVSPISGDESLWNRLTCLARTTVVRTISLVDDAAIRGILHAAFLGETNLLTSTTRETFRQAGIYHLLAISGLHVAILTSSLYLLCLLMPLPRAAKVTVTVAAIWAYLFFVGFRPSLFRAVVMATFILLSFIFQRENATLNALGVAGIAWLLLSPLSLSAPGYQLSFAATFGIVTLVPLLQSLIVPSSDSAVANLLVKPVAIGFSISLAGFLSTAPVLAHHFGAISLFGLAANIIAVPLMGIAMNCFFAGMAAELVFPPAAAIAMKLTAFLLSCIEQIAAMAWFVPWTQLTVPVPSPILTVSFVAILLGLAAIRRNLAATYMLWALPVLLLLIPVTVMLHALVQPPAVTFLSVMDGSVAAVRFPNNKVWLIGAAPETPYGHPFRDAIQPWFRRQPAPDFDVLLLPALSTNVVHDLDPILHGKNPESVITCYSPCDAAAGEDLKAFLQSYGTQHIEAGHDWRIIPSPGCTCTISLPRPGISGPCGYVAQPSAHVTLTIGQTVFSFTTSRDSYASAGRHSSARMPAVTASPDKLMITATADASAPQSNTSRMSTRSFDLRETGAVIVTLDQDGIHRVRTAIPRDTGMFH